MDVPTFLIGFIVYLAVGILAVIFLPTWLFIVLFTCVNAVPTIIYNRHHKRKSEEIKGKFPLK